MKTFNFYQPSINRVSCLMLFLLLNNLFLSKKQFTLKYKDRWISYISEKIGLYNICFFKNYASSVTWPLDSTSCPEFNILSIILSTLHKVRNVTIIYYTLREWMAMEVLLHDFCIQRHVLGSTLCALYIRLEIYL